TEITYLFFSVRRHVCRFLPILRERAKKPLAMKPVLIVKQSQRLGGALCVAVQQQPATQLVSCGLSFT
ncbi:hypothetical protein, partial [Sinorhizobium meliloti]|uniref:hypothetical protein n=1 Tax=Rhizobium meliloti TaxID=382 RepID=UPI001AECD668